METVYILIGSNLGDREKNLDKAVGKMNEIEGLEIIARSSIYMSEAVGMTEDSPAFMNQVVKADYKYRPLELLNALELIEKNMGRTGKGQNLPRTLDLDILLFGDEIIETAKLSIPHREFLNRPFAMIPVLQIDPDIIHPVTGTPVEEFLKPDDLKKAVIYKDHVARFI